MRNNALFGLVAVVGAVALGIVLSSRGQDPGEDTSLAALERQVAREGAAIELEMKKIRRRLAQQGAGGKEVIAAIDGWLTDNRERFEAHRAAAISLAEARGAASAPAPPAPDPDADPRENEAAQLQFDLDQGFRQSRADAGGAREAQGLYDAWLKQPENAAKLARLQEIGRELSEEARKDRTEIFIPVPEDPTPDELAAADIQEEIALKELQLAADNPEATAREMQAIRDAERAFFEEKHAELRAIGERISRAELDREITALEAILAEEE